MTLTQVCKGRWVCTGVMLGLLASSVSQARTLCVYDPAGMGGEAWRAGQDYRLEMGSQGVDMDLKAYTNERVAVEDFKAGQCDAVMATALRTRQFLSLIHI